MDTYIVDRLGIETNDVTAFRETLFHRYGTTLRGLREEYGINENDFLAYVHDIPLEQYLEVDPKLASVLEMFPGRKAIFTNADKNHAIRVLRRLGVNTYFEQIIDILSIHPYCKPMPQAFEKALDLLGNPDPAAVAANRATSWTNREAIGAECLFPTQAKALEAVHEESHRGSSERRCPLLEVVPEG